MIVSALTRRKHLNRNIALILARCSRSSGTRGPSPYSEFFLHLRMSFPLRRSALARAGLDFWAKQGRRNSGVAKNALLGEDRNRDVSDHSPRLCRMQARLPAGFVMSGLRALRLDPPAPLRAPRP